MNNESRPRKKVIFSLPFALKGIPCRAQASKGRAGVGIGEKICNNYINPTPYPMRTRDPNPPPEGEGNFGLFTTSSIIDPNLIV
jgi:hypothetical protein